MSVTNINIDIAKKEREQLLKAVGTENNPGQWIVFMSLVDELLPFLSNQRGPTSKEDVERSLIGAFGFSGWEKMVVAPVSEGGLGMKLNTWRKWKDTYKFVKAYPYLSDMNLSQPAIVKLQSVFGSVDDGNWPESSEEMEKSRLAILKKQQEDKVKTLKELEQRVVELESQLSEANAVNEQLQKQADSMMKLAADFKPLAEKLSAAERGADEQRQINNQLKIDMNKLNDEKKMLSQNVEKLMAANKNWKTAYNEKGVVGWFKGLFGNK